MAYLRDNGWCPYHGPGAVLPGAMDLRAGRQRNPVPTAVEVPIYHGDYLPSLRQEASIVPKLLKWAAEFDSIDAERYTALQFIEWLGLELAPPVKAKEDTGREYPVLGLVAAGL